MGFLTNLNMNSGEILILLFAGLSQCGDPALAVLKVPFQLLDLKFEAANVQIASCYSFLEALDVPVTLLRIACCVSQVSFEALDFALFLVVSALHHSKFGSQLSVFFILLWKLAIRVLNVVDQLLLFSLPIYRLSAIIVKIYFLTYSFSHLRIKVLDLQNVQLFDQILNKAEILSHFQLIFLFNCPLYLYYGIMNTLSSVACLYLPSRNLNWSLSWE